MIQIHDRGGYLVVLDHRSGKQKRFRVEKLNVDYLGVNTGDDSLVINVKTLEYQISPNPISANGKSCAPINCQHLGPVMPAERFPPAEGLGDLVSDGLSAIGLTKDRWNYLVTLGKSSGVCEGCNARQTFVNWLGSQIPGFTAGQGPLLHQLLETTNIPAQPVHACALHGKCLTKTRYVEPVKAAIEQAGFRQCHGCADQKLVPIEIPVEKP